MSPGFFVSLTARAVGIHLILATQRPSVAVIADSVAAKSLADAIEIAGAMALECEPSGTEGICSPLMGIGVCLPGGEPVYVPAGTELKALQPVIESAGVKLYVHDYKVVWLALRKNGVAPARAAFVAATRYSYAARPARASLAPAGTSAASSPAGFQ